MELFKNHIKNNKGFSLIEAVMALAVMGILLTSIFALQQTMMQATFSANNKLGRLFILKNVLYDPSVVRENHDEARKKEQKIKEPTTLVKLMVDKPVDEQLKKYELERIRVQAEWDEFIGKQKEELELMRFVVPKKDRA